MPGATLASSGATLTNAFINYSNQYVSSQNSYGCYIRSHPDNGSYSSGVCGDGKTGGRGDGFGQMFVCVLTSVTSASERFCCVSMDVGGDQLSMKVSVIFCSHFIPNKLG